MPLALPLAEPLAVSLPVVPEALGVLVVAGVLVPPLALVEPVALELLVPLAAEPVLLEGVPALLALPDGVALAPVPLLPELLVVPLLEQAAIPRAKSAAAVTIFGFMIIASPLSDGRNCGVLLCKRRAAIGLG